MNVLQAVFRWYLVEAVTLLALTVVLTGRGFERLLWAGVVLMGVIALVHKYLGQGAAVRALKAVLGLLAVTLGAVGLGLAGFGVLLASRGSFGILAGMVLVPGGLGVAGISWAGFKMALATLAPPESDLTGLGALAGERLTGVPPEPEA